jgi:hypothetical protein
MILLGLTLSHDPCTPDGTTVSTLEATCQLCPHTRTRAIHPRHVGTLLDGGVSIGSVSLVLLSHNDKYSSWFSADSPPSLKMLERKAWNIDCSWRHDIPTCHALC